MLELGVGLEGNEDGGGVGWMLGWGWGWVGIRMGVGLEGCYDGGVVG